MESRYSKFVTNISNGVIANFDKRVPHNNKNYTLNLSYNQTKIIKGEIYAALSSIELSDTQKLILKKLTDEQLKEFSANLTGYLSFQDDFSLFSKDAKVKKGGLTEVYYDNLIFDLAEFKDEKFWNTWPLNKLGAAKPPAEELQTRINMPAAGARKEFIIAVYCKTLANFGSHENHLALAKELQKPDNQIIAAMRKPYGSISFFSSAKEINSKAYFSYQHHIFTSLLGAKVVTEAFKDKNLPLDMGRELSFFLKQKDVNSLACVNAKAAKMKRETREEYEKTFYRKRT